MGLVKSASFYLKSLKIAFLFIQILLSGFLISSGMLRTDGRIIINDNNEKVILKGFGLGGWLVLEGYMWNFPGFRSTTTMENAVVGLLGEEKEMDLFFDRYRSNYITEKEISFLAESGLTL